MSISVNGVAISDEAVFAEMQYHPAPSPDEAQGRAAEALVIRELMRQEARVRGLGEDDDAIDRLLEADVNVPEADAATCRRYYDQNRRRFRSPDLIEAQHILIAAPPDDPKAKAAAKTKADAVASEATRDPSRFEALAREHSDCPSKSSGGHLGQITPGATVPELDSYLFSLSAGETCPVAVSSRYGWHVIRVLRREPGRDLPFEHVERRIRDYLAESVWRRAVAQYVSVLAGRARIEGIEVNAASSPLVQ